MVVKSVSMSDYMNEKLVRVSKEFGMSQSKLIEISLTLYLTLYAGSQNNVKTLNDLILSVPEKQLSMLDDLFKK
jgi:hypothetical protein